MKDLSFKDLSYKALSKYCEMNKAHPRSISFLSPGCPTKDYPCNETKGRGTPIARRILILRSSLLLSGRTIWT